MKILATRKEDDKYFQGPFWIIAKSVQEIHRGNFEIIGEKFLSDYNGNYEDNTLSKSQRTHKKIWETEYAEKYNQSDYSYYPRGRVAICGGVAFIHLNSKCNIPKVIDKIQQDYGISKLDCEIDLNDTYQGSHYDFKLPITV